MKNVDVNINDWKVKKRLYIATKALFAIKHIEFVRKKQFIGTVFNLKNKTFKFM